MENGSLSYDLYEDIRQRTGGEIYIGVLGPVRTGKSTFIKRFMDELVLPNMEDDPARHRALDELPQSAGGRTITTTEPKFVPSKAAKISVDGGMSSYVRLIDCVGYMVDGAVGHMEAEEERMVKTPWFKEEIPFTKAAAIGTDKVMQEHSTIGIVITTDGSIGEIPRENYVAAEERTILSMKQQNKPFLVIVNSKRPYSDEAMHLASNITQKYDVTCMTANCEQLKKEEILTILQNVLYEFPISSIDFYMPRWIELLEDEHPLKEDLIAQTKMFLTGYDKIRDAVGKPISMESPYLTECTTEQIRLSDGSIKVRLLPDDKYYYEMLSGLLEENILGEYDLLEKLRDYAKRKKEYEKVQSAVEAVTEGGYGVVSPEKEEIQIKAPQIIHHGNKYGVRMTAVSPSIHMIKVGVETEIAPIVGTKEQAEELKNFLEEAMEKEEIWDTSIFGKSVGELVQDGFGTKLNAISMESQMKLKDTMQKIVNDSNGGMVCIII